MRAPTMRRCAPPTSAAPSADRRLTRCNLVLQAVEAAAKQLETDLAKGIDPNTLQQREVFFGEPNRIQQPERECWYSYMMSAFSNC